MSKEAVFTSSQHPSMTRGSGSARPSVVRRLGVALVMWVVLGLGRAVADGKVFPPRAVPVEVRIPDQRALLWWTNGLERLVIETRFAGQGTNFAWVVPLPSVPRVEAATSGLFPTLDHLLQTQVIDSPPRHFAVALLAASFLWLFLTVRKSSPQRPADGMALLGLAVGVGLVSSEVSTGLPFGLVVALVALWAVRRVRRGEESWWVVPVGFGILMLVAGMLLPALATAKAGGGSGPAVKVLDRQFADVFETTTITGRDPASLRGWLENHGFAMPKDVEPVIAEYLREGWVFAASRVRRDAASNGTNSLPPLGFTFASREPVYPLRLTGVGNGPLDVELFVFGPERAKVEGLTVLDCRPTDYRLPEYPEWFVPRDRLVMAHPGLAAAAPGAGWVTRLSGVLSPERMRKDATVQWDGFSEARDVRYSARGAWITVLNRTVSALCLLILGVAGVARLRGREPVVSWRPSLAVALVAALITALMYTRLPVIPVRLEARFSRLSDAKNQFLAVQLALMDELPTNAPVTLESAREAIRRGLGAQISPSMRAKLGYEIREEDSPYHYSLHQVPGGVEVRFYDAWGRAEVERFPE